MKWAHLILCPILCLLLLSLCPLSGCTSLKAPYHSAPVTLTLWHNFGGQMQTTMDELVDDFNNTEGRKQGIILSVTSISGSASIQEKLAMIAADDPGAPDMPDIATCYPHTAIMLADNNLLASLDEQFTQKELSAYLPRFVEEGRLLDGKLYVFPIAKSTEVLFLNETLFNRFSGATGITIDSLSTFEGIAEASLRYYQWTDTQTPDIPNDGKSFYMADSLFNLAQVGMQQLGGNLIKNESLQLSSPRYRHIWECIYEPAVKGGYAIYDGYSSDLSKTGEIICSIGSTAGILFYGSEIIYPDNTTEQVKYTVLPFPLFKGGEKVAIQRGSGMIVASSTPEKEKAAAVFLKWFTAPEQNLKFVSSTGYLPVTHQAFNNIAEHENSLHKNENIKKLLEAAIKVHQEYDFFIPPVFDAYNSLSKKYEQEMKALAKSSREEYLALLEILPPNEAYERATEGDFEAFVSVVQ